MDQTDRNILSYLRDDGRASYTELADELGVSEGTVRNRVQRMKEEGVIERFTVETKVEGISAVVMAKISTDTDISEILGSLTEGIDFYEVTGDYDLVMEIERETTEELNEEIDSVRAVEGVVDTKTYPVLNRGQV
jgi:DNA-binding Lrp family transcriptional regulator